MNIKYCKYMENEEYKPPILKLEEIDPEVNLIFDAMSYQSDSDISGIISIDNETSIEVSRIDTDNSSTKKENAIATIDEENAIITINEEDAIATIDEDGMDNQEYYFGSSVSCISWIRYILEERY